jgi:osmoprotectant transport system permease protein
MRRRHAEASGIRRISDLTQYARQLSIGGDYEFFTRPEWIAIRDAYRLAFASERTMDPSLMYQAVAGEQVDVISAYSTDGRIAAMDLIVLEDDRRAIPPYDALVLVGPRLVREHPDVLGALRQLAGKIDADRMRKMNRAVDQDGASPAAVAESFLRELRATQ